MKIRQSKSLHAFLGLICVLLVTACPGLAQEKLDFMAGNPVQLRNASVHPKSWYPAHLSGITDTLELPLEDDFSTDLFADYYFFSCPPALRQGHLFRNRLINGQASAGSITYSRTRTTTTDSTQTPPLITLNDSLELSFFNYSSSYPGSPLLPDSVYFVYTPYDILIRSNGISDTITVDIPITDSLITDSLYTIRLNHKNFIWLDRYPGVYRNIHFPISPPSLGVATFDGTAWNGLPYNNFLTPNAQGSADTLTSKPINLNYNPVSGVYLSFYYQAKGRGNAPEFIDSLFLEFRSPVKRWTRVWGKTGFDPGNDTAFKKVTLHITDTSWLKTGFQFRFRNYATLVGNCDHWHIDYVRIVSLPADTLINDIGFAQTNGNLLYPYSAVPFNQFSTAYMSPLTSEVNRITNLSSSDANLNYRFRITDFAGQVQQTGFNVDNVVFYPSSTNNCESCTRVINPFNGLGYTFPPMSECTEYRIKQWIEPLAISSIRGNDTLDRIQTFGDYFSFDDGSAELAYGMENSPLSEVLYRIDILSATTLQGLYVHFSPFSNDARQQEFSIVLRGHDAQSDLPGDSIYEEGGKIPLYSSTENGFTRYLLNSQVSLSPGIYYVGIRNFGSASLNIGFDVANNRQDHVFIKMFGGSWYNSQFAGSPLMRPITAFCANGLPSAVTQPGTTEIASVYPNPSQGFVYLPAGYCSIYNMQGKLLLRLTSSGNEPTDLQELESGLYLIHIQTSEGKTNTQKLMLQKP